MDWTGKMAQPLNARLTSKIKLVYSLPIAISYANIGQSANNLEFEEKGVFKKHRSGD